MNKSKMRMRIIMPIVLSIVGALGVGVTVYTTFTSTKKYINNVPEDAREKPIHSVKDIGEKTMLMAPHFIAPAVSGVLTVACIVISATMSQNRQKSLAAAYIVLNNAYKNYRNTNLLVNGPDSVTNIYEKMCPNIPRASDGNLIVFFDSFTELVFETTLETFLTGIIQANRELAWSGCISLNNLYSLCNVPTVPYGDDVGWSCDMFTELSLPVFIDLGIKRKTDDHNYCTVFYETNPGPAYLDYWN